MNSIQEPRSLIVGVDYGTTFSGISYVYSDAAGIEDINVMSWGSSARSASSNFETQVPSRIAYGPRSEITWGSNTTPGSTVYCWTKLLLDRYASTTSFDDEGLTEVDGAGLLKTLPGKTPEDVVADFLTQLYREMMVKLERAVGSAILRVTPIKFYFTIPAVWSVRAENATLQAAQKAGFGPGSQRPDDIICLIREPEAAAISALNGLIKDGESSLVRAGTGVLVCDCGGGTVDLTSYEIAAAHPRVSLNQACVSEGGKCGSTTIDRDLNKLMRQRFGAAFQSVPLESRGMNSRFMNDFESAKRDFGSARHSMTYRLHLKMKAPNSRWFEKEDDEVLFTTDDMQLLFDPVVAKIRELVKQQISATKIESGLDVKTILLVGGFGCSPYLFQKLKSWCPAGIELINPPRAWEAICLGASVRGLEGRSVMKTKSRRHTGIQVSREFQVGIDDEASGFTDLFTGLKMARGYMDWMVARGEIITPETVKRRGPYKPFWIEDTPKVWSLVLYESNVGVAPEKDDHPSIKEVGKMEIDLTSLNFDGFPSKEFKPTPYQGKTLKVAQVAFDIVTVVEGDLGYMHSRAVCLGKQVGEVRLSLRQETGPEASRPQPFLP